MVVKDRIAKRPCGKTCVRDVLREFPLSRAVRHASTVCRKNSPFNIIGRLKGTWMSIKGNDVMAMSREAGTEAEISQSHIHLFQRVEAESEEI